YTVKRGDTLGAIADRLGVGLSELARENDLRPPYRLHPGQVLKNPKAAKAAARPERSSSGSGGGSYTVKSGDTLYGIARQHGVSLEALQAANGMTGRSSIRPGQKLKLPGGAEQAEAAEDEAAPPERAEPPRASSRRSEPSPSRSAAE